LYVPSLQASPDKPPDVASIICLDLGAPSKTEKNHGK